MGAVKEMMMDCFDSGVVPVEESSVGLWAGMLGDRADILAGMPMKHRHDGRRGPVDVSVIPIVVAAQVVAIVPEAEDELGWMLDMVAESHL